MRLFRSHASRGRNISFENDGTNIMTAEVSFTFFATTPGKLLSLPTASNPRINERHRRIYRHCRQTSAAGFGSEQSLLGGLLLDNRRWDEVVDEVKAGDFYHQNHRLIFEAIAGLQGANDPADIVTASEWLEKQGDLARVGGLAYLSTLANNTPGTANILTYARIVRERAILRALIAAANDISANAYNRDGKTPREVLDYAQQKVLEISEGDEQGRDGFISIQELLTGSGTRQGVIDRIDELFESKEAITGIPTGFNDLDEQTSGLQRGDLVIVAGRPSMGKTAFCPQYRQICRDKSQGIGRAFQHGNARRAVGDAHARLGLAKSIPTDYAKVNCTTTTGRA